MRPPGSYRYALYLVWFSLWIIAGLVVFSRGFFLSRRAVPDVSVCIPLERITCDGLPSDDKDESCTLDAKISAVLARSDSALVCASEPTKIILIVVDALRYDFVEYNESLKTPLAYQNKLPFARELLQLTDKTRLFKFIADPPTTTLQRLKGLMTGSLPTFIDAGSNFASTEIMEDNLIDQILLGGGTAVLLGDDTWLRLFPGRWLRTHAQYSFHTWDLDTVDREVDSRIYAELEAGDWRLLVAHYLGVDHAGHRHGPRHAEMERKLRELDARLRRVVALMPRDAVLCVVGDHGMTDTGDHGGESASEVTSAMLVHAPTGLAWSAAMGASTRQTDLAATLAVVAGRVSPASSLGLLEPAALPRRLQTQWRRTLLSLVSNLDQVMRYTARYAEQSTELDATRLGEASLPYAALRARAAGLTTERQFREYYEDVKQFMDELRALCHRAWVEFDSVAIARGALVLFMAVFFNYLFVEGIPHTSIPSIFGSSFVACAYSWTGLAAAVSVTLWTSGLVDELEQTTLVGAGMAATAVTAVLVAQHWDGVAERWHSRRDAAPHERMARAAIVASAVAMLSNSYVISAGGVSAFLLLSALAMGVRAAGAPRSTLLLWTVVGIALLLTRPYRACREEQQDCWSGAGSGATGEASRYTVLMAMLSLGATVAAVRHWCGGFSSGLWRWGPAAVAVCVCGHWSAAWGGAGSARRSATLARAAWAGLAVLLALLLHRPGRAETALLRLALIVHVACVLTLGPTAATPAALVLAAAAATLSLLASLRRHLSEKLDTCRTETLGCVAWCLLGVYWMYATGHTATLAHLRWSAAFHAGALPTERAWARGLVAVFLALNTFGGHLVLGMASPLLVLWRGGADSSDDARPPFPAIFTSCLKLQLCYALRLAGCVMAATIHCRHLMVWSVFAPQLMYEAGACLAALLGVCLGFLMLLHASRRGSVRPHDS